MLNNGRGKVVQCVAADRDVAAQDVKAADDGDVEAVLLLAVVRLSKPSAMPIRGLSPKAAHATSPLRAPRSRLRL